MFVNSSSVDMKGQLFLPHTGIGQTGQQDAATSLLSQLILTMTLAWTQLGKSRSTTKLLPSYDYIVVGGGTAGSVVAARLAQDPNINVLLLEAGGSPSNESNIPRVMMPHISGESPLIRKITSAPQQHVCGRDPDGNCVLRYGNLLGGSSSINAMMWVTGNKLDYDDWAKQGLPSWSYDEVSKIFRALENNLDIINNTHHGYGGPVETTHRNRWDGLDDLTKRFLDSAEEMNYTIGDYNGEKQASYFKYFTNVKDAVRQSSEKAFIEPMENKPNLHKVMFARVQKVLFEGTRAVGVQYLHENQTKTIQASREVIISSGALLTPQILMLSGIGDVKYLRSMKIPVVADVPGVGQNFHDHVRCDINFTTSLEFPKDGHLTNETLNLYKKHKIGVFASNFAGVAHIRTRHSKSEDDVQGQICLSYEASEAKNSSTGYNFMVRLLNWVHKPIARGTVRLNSTNQLDQSKPFSLAQSKPFRDINMVPIEPHLPKCEHLVPWDENYLNCYIKYVCTNDYHYVGSAKMGSKKDPMGVVDERLKVRGVTGLRVADASVMPSVPRANTMAPAMMIGWRAAEFIKEEEVDSEKKVVN